MRRRRRQDEALAPPRPARDALRVCDGNDRETYITPELYWSSAAGIARTRNMAGTGLFGVSTW